MSLNKIQPKELSNMKCIIKNVINKRLTDKFVPEQVKITSAFFIRLYSLTQHVWDQTTCYSRSLQEVAELITSIKVFTFLIERLHN